MVMLIPIDSDPDGLGVQLTDTNEYGIARAAEYADVIAAGGEHVYNVR